MPNSHPENKQWILDKLVSINPQYVLDVGPGEGTYGTRIKKVLPNAQVDAVEVWEPYVTKYKLNDIYYFVEVKDIRDHNNFNYDVVIFGDILEHMSEEDAKKVWAKAKAQAKYAIISVPIIHFPQGEHAGNPYEVHVEEDWNTERVLKAFPEIIDSKDFSVTGAYLAKFI